MDFEALSAQLREVFRVEAGELLAELEEGLLQLEEDPGDVERINRVFRALHTLKGSGATSGFESLSRFLHQIEDVFSQAREGRVELSSALIDRTLEIKDVIEKHIHAEAALAEEILAGAAPLLETFLSVLEPAAGEAPAGPVDTATPEAGTRRFRIDFAPDPEFFQFGQDPQMYLEELASLGTVLQQDARVEALPDFFTLDPESSYLEWTILLETSAEREEIEDVFAFVVDECALTIEEVKDEAPVALVEGGQQSWALTFIVEEAPDPEVWTLLWQTLRSFGEVRANLDPASTVTGAWKVLLDTSAAIGEIRDAFLFVGVEPELHPVDEPAAAPSATEAPAAAPEARTKDSPASPEEAPARAPRKPPAAAAGGSSAGQETMRVAAEKLDRLVDMVGELVILRAQVTNACHGMTEVPVELESAAEGLDRLSGSLRDLVLEVRTMPIGETFSKFRRVARDLSRELGKPVDLVVEGAETAMDKTILEQLRDPLLHLVRNALDHGIETPEERASAGKPARARLRLAAEQRGDRVWITVEDDGRGIDPAAVRAKAIAKGLVDASTPLTDAEAQMLIFHPGLSTKDAVSAISGRGVGLDVVKRQLELMRGSVSLESRFGEGTRIELAVPLTLAIIEGLLVRIDQDHYVLPLSAARETIEMTAAQRARFNRRNLIEVREEWVPFVCLRELFDYDSPRPDREKVVIVEINGRPLGFVIDEVIGNHQTVLKSLGWLGRRVDVFSGATVLGDGRIGLICDLPNILRLHEASGPRTETPRPEPALAGV